MHYEQLVVEVVDVLVGQETQLCTVLTVDSQQCGAVCVCVCVCEAADRDLNVGRQMSLQLFVSGESSMKQLVGRHRTARAVGRHCTDHVAQLKLELLSHVHQDTLTQVDRSKSVGKRSRFHRLAAL